VSLANEISGILKPDPDRDVVFKLQDQNNDTTTYFRISSKVLRLASPAFDSMFSPYFKEGQTLPKRELPVIELEDDDPLLMGLILNVLHYRAGGEDHVMNAEKLARLAIHWDEYDCVDASGPWVLYWFKNVERMSQSPRDVGFVLQAAYLFNNSEKFMDLSKATSTELAPNFYVEWEEADTLVILPTSISSELMQDAFSCDYNQSFIGGMTIRIKRILNKLEAELQSIELSLRNSSRCYDTLQLFCINCGRTLPGQAKKCHPCSNTELPHKYCTSETRIADYFAVLRKVELWPTAKPFGTCSVSDTVTQFTCAKTDLKHSCAAGTSCPLVINLDSLSERVNRIRRNVNGFCLRCIREEDDE
jgi:hypothetical protein